MGGGFRRGRSISRNEKTKELKDGILRGCVPRYGNPATCCVAL